MAEAEDDTGVFVHHHRGVFALVQQVGAPCALAVILVGEGDGDLRVRRAILRQLVLHLRHVDVTTTVAARIRLILITRTNLQPLGVGARSVFIGEKVLIVVRNGRGQRSAAVVMHAVAQPHVAQVRLEGGLVLIRCIGVFDIHHRRAEVIVGEDVRLSLFCRTIVRALNIERVVKVDMAVGKEAGGVHVRRVVVGHDTRQAGLLGEAVGLVALGGDEDRAVAVVVIVRGAAQLYVTALCGDGYVAHLLVCVPEKEGQLVLGRDVTAGADVEVSAVARGQFVGHRGGDALAISPNISLGVHEEYVARIFILFLSVKEEAVLDINILTGYHLRYSLLDALYLILRLGADVAPGTDKDLVLVLLLDRELLGA